MATNGEPFRKAFSISNFVFIVSPWLVVNLNVINLPAIGDKASV